MMDEKYRLRRDEFEANFAQRTRVSDSVQNYRSPGGDFLLEISEYAGAPNSWAYSRGIVRARADGAVIADIRRNLGAFWHVWVAHPNGHEYLLCGEDYQGYNVIDLHTGENRVYFPDEAFAGGGFCWVDVYPSPDGRILAVGGCVWANTNELVFHDFSDPAMLPLPELARFGDVGTELGWRDETTFEFTLEDEAGNTHPACWNHTSPDAARRNPGRFAR